MVRISRGRQDGLPSTTPTDTFTGSVRGDSVLPREDGAMVLTVVFAPGARTHWHTHTGGQVLFVTHGEGYVQTRAGNAARVRAGDVVHFAPDEEHWHGAGPSTYLVHTAVSIGETDWLDAVTDDEHAAGVQAGSR